MRTAILFAMGGLIWAQTPNPVPDPAYAPLSRAYEALRVRAYEPAIADFMKAIEAAPKRASIRKDLAYTYLKIGENILARDQFREAMTIDPADTQVAMEYAFLCYETKEQAEARRIFDRIRKTGNATAEKAFQNIDAPLAAGIERWKGAISMGADNFSAHFELATLAEQRDELALAAEHYEKAWRLLPDRRSVLVDLGRVLKAAGEGERANAALLAASRGGETRAAEMARELLPQRYPYVSEFQHALDLDPKNVELRRELGFLLLQMGRAGDAEREFRALTEPPPGDLLSVTQLGLLLYSRGARAEATPLFQRVLDSNDEDLSNRVREVLHLPLKIVVAGPSHGGGQSEGDAKAMAERSLQAGYMKDALHYFEMAHEQDPGDYSVMLKLGWANNILHRDALAFHWFDLARRSPDSKVAAEAAHARDNLRPSVELFRTTAWFYPLFSTRWHDQFGYAQVKTELRSRLPIKPYVSVRFVGDSRQTIGTSSAGAAPQYLSESSFIVAAGVRTETWHGATGWFEAGSAMSYITGHMLPDYRGGISAARGTGKTLGSESPGAFADTTLDAIFVSRFGNDSLLYSQSRFGYTLGPRALRVQVYCNANATVDTQRQYWANFLETGPGVRFTAAAMPTGMFVTVNLLRGAYLINQGNPRGPNFNDLRVGVWYAFTR
jgi:Tfp pilus assembly protein PilF